MSAPFRRLFRRPWSLDDERLVVFIAIVAIVLFRSAMFVFERWLDFDSDQAIFGLMAKHLSEGRAFPLFMYGQNYVLAVEAWLAAPLFVLAGASVPALKLPLLAANLATALLLVRLLERECGVRPLHGLVASLFFVLAPPGTAAVLTEASGGIVEVFLYVLLLWVTRRRPVWFGLIAGLGFLQREFTIYGVIGVVTLELGGRVWRRRDDWRPLLAALRVAAEAWLIVQVLRPFAPALGPGTTLANMRGAPSSGVAEILNRICFDPRTIVSGVEKFVTIHWGQLFGTAVLPAHAFSLESETSQGLTGSGLALLTLALVMVARVAMQSRRDRASWTRYRFCVYLLLVGGLSATMYVVARCGTVSAMRYDVLSIFCAVGLTAWFLSIERTRWLRGVAIGVITAWAAVSAVAHGRIWSEYLSRPPVAAKAVIIRQLEARGIRYARSDYWIAYYVTFMTDERIIVATGDYVRIREYQREVEAHRARAVRISRSPCAGGREVVAGVYFCALE